MESILYLLMSWWCKSWYWSGGWFNIKMSSYQYGKSHCGEKMILWPFHLHNPQWISYTGKMASLYWISPLVLLENPHFSTRWVVRLRNLRIPFWMTSVAQQVQWNDGLPEGLGRKAPWRQYGSVFLKFKIWCMFCVCHFCDVSNILLH